MTKVELTVPAGDVVCWVEGELARLSLEFRQMALAKYPGAVHWHIRRPGSAGTLEATWWPQEERFWLEQRAGRAAAWQDEVVRAMVASTS